jgi:hypothetical protein
VWVLRAFRDAVIAAILTSVRGWIALICRPWESARLIAALPLNVWRTRTLLGGLFGPGLTVLTPAGEAPQLRTVVIGLGDLTTRTAQDAAPTPALVKVHFEAVRERLAPLAATPEALVRLSALVMPALMAYANRNTDLSPENLPDVAFDLLSSAFLISFTWGFGVRIATLLLQRRLQRWLERAP